MKKSFSILIIIIVLLSSYIYGEENIVNILPPQLVEKVIIGIPNSWNQGYNSKNLYFYATDNDEYVIILMHIQSYSIQVERSIVKYAMNSLFSHYSYNDVKVLPHSINLVQCQSFLLKEKETEIVYFHYHVELASDFGMNVFIVDIQGEYENFDNIKDDLLLFFKTFSNIETLPILPSKDDFQEISPKKEKEKKHKLDDSNSNEIG